MGKLRHHKLLTVRELSLVVLSNVSVIFSVIVVFSDLEIALELTERVDDLKAGEQDFIIGDHVVEGLADSKASTESCLGQVAKDNWENTPWEEHIRR